jgi:Na+-transporting methylmalonyl-CoA/oxaloacetate decarboxylase gamma subunit
MSLAFFAWLYGGPDQLMPLTSGLAAVFAFLLIFWNKVLVFFGKVARLFHGRSRHEPEQAGTSDPQVRD